MFGPFSKIRGIIDENKRGLKGSQDGESKVILVAWDTCKQAENWKSKLKKILTGSV